MTKITGEAIKNIPSQDKCEACLDPVSKHKERKIQDAVSKWRGFNLQGMFASSTSIYAEKFEENDFKEEHFKIVKELGFNFVRIPFSYRIWSTVDDPFTIDESKQRLLDDAVEYGEKYGLHVNIAMHRAPGYCVNRDETPEEKLSLWKDDEALDAFKFQWRSIIERFRNVSADRLSYDVINEPGMEFPRLGDYNKICLAMFDIVNEVSPDKMVMIDGIGWGELPPIETVINYTNDNFIYSCRGYTPLGVTHYRVGQHHVYDNIDPVWPGGARVLRNDKNGNPIVTPWTAERLDQMYSAWAALGKIYNVPVFCGEFGCYNKTPHDVALAWMEDLLKILNKNKIGFAMWNLVGAFGILNSGRDDVEYEDLYGYKLDRKMLELMQRY